MLGSVCPHCCFTGKGKGRVQVKGKKTATSIHGSCLECGYQKFYSRYRKSVVRAKEEGG